MEQVPAAVANDKPLLMDKAYEGNTCRAKAKNVGCARWFLQRTIARNRGKLYKGRNVVERNFRNIKQFRRVFTQYDKLDETYNALISIVYVCIHSKN